MAAAPVPTAGQRHVIEYVCAWAQADAWLVLTRAANDVLTSFARGQHQGASLSCRAGRRAGPGPKGHTMITDLIAAAWWLRRHPRWLAALTVLDAGLFLLVAARWGLL